LSNGGFEQGTTGWEASGHATTETASFGEAPHQGAKQALITNRNQAAGNVPVSELESFLKLSRGRISAISSGTPTAGSAIRQTIQVQAGDVVTFRFSFLTNESTPAGAYNDLACFSYSGASENAVVLLSDTHASGFADSPTTLKASTGYRTYQHTFTTGGQVTIGFAVIDAKDTGYDSALLLDGVEVARGTNQHSAPVTSGSESVLTNGNFASGLSGWNATGHATADLAGLKETPPVQSGQAWVSTSDSDGGSVAVGELESFLGVSSGSLNGLNDARATAGSAIRQTITAQAGTTLRVRYRFLTNEKTPATGFKDFAFLTLAGSQASEAILLADTTSGGFATSDSIYRESTGYRTVEVVLSETGPVTIGFGVSDAKDTSFDSALLIDQIELVDGA
jgi:hypothetical protein